MRLPAPRVQQSNPDGQIASDLQNTLSSPKIKNISLFQKGKSVADLFPSRPDKRGVGQRHNVGRGAVDAEVPTTNGTMPGEAFWRRRVLRTAKSCGPDAAVLASSWRVKSR